MQRREEVRINETSRPSGVTVVPQGIAGQGIASSQLGGAGLIGANVQQKGHTVVKDDLTGAKQKVDFERKTDVEGGGKFEYHVKEDAGCGGPGRKVDYERRDDPKTGTHKVDYKERSDDKADDGVFSKLGRKMGLKD